MLSPVVGSWSLTMSLVGIHRPSSANSHVCFVEFHTTEWTRP
jgi:hypothetical protein